MYDLILKGGRIYDGSGLPSFNGDVAIRDGKIAAIGRINESAERVLDVGGLAIAPGIIDFHTHFDAQLWWDPLASSSNEHGVTTVVTGNCGLTLAPCKPESRDALIGTFVRVEAMPRASLQAGIPWQWTTHGEYLDALRAPAARLERRHAHRSLRRASTCHGRSQRRARSQRQRNRRDGRTGSPRHGRRRLRFFNQLKPEPLPRRRQAGGKPILQLEEIARLCRVVGESQRGLVQFTHGAFATPEHVAHISRWYDTILQETRRPLIGESIRHRWSEPELWRKQLHDVEARARQGYAAYAMTSTRRSMRRWTLKDGARLDLIPAWKKLSALPIAERMENLRDPNLRNELAQETVDGKPIDFSRRWDLISVQKVARRENQSLEGKSIAEIATAQHKSPIDAMLDLALAEDLATTFEDSTTQGDEQAVKEIFCNPNVLLGQSDAGAHVASGNPGFGYATLMLAYWVRERQLMTLEDAIKKLTFLPASIFGIHDRGLLRRGLAADLFVFDPEKIDLAAPAKVSDLPEGAARFTQGATGIHYTIVNGKVLMDNGAHSGAYPGEVLRSS